MRRSPRAARSSSTPPAKRRTGSGKRKPGTPPSAEIRRLADEFDAALTAAVRAAYAARRAAIGPLGYDDRIYRRKAMAKPHVHALTAEAEHLLTLRETYRLNDIPAVPFDPAP